MVHVSDDKKQKFKRTDKGLYQYEIPSKYKESLEISHIIDTVAENKLAYNKRQFD